MKKSISLNLVKVAGKLSLGLSLLNIWESFSTLTWTSLIGKIISSAYSALYLLVFRNSKLSLKDKHKIKSL